MQGRIGDSPLIGCGGYANEHGGCSTTGHGESLMKMTLAREAVYNIEKGHDAQVILTIISHFYAIVALALLKALVPNRSIRSPKQQLWSRAKIFHSMATQQREMDRGVFHHLKSM